MSTNFLKTLWRLFISAVAKNTNKTEVLFLIVLLEKIKKIICENNLNNKHCDWNWNSKSL